MATIRREVHIQAAPEKVWDAMRDVGALHTRLCPEFVTDTKMEGSDARLVTFANGRQARELIVSVDDATRRVCWAIVDEPFVHYNGAAHVTAAGRRHVPVHLGLRSVAERAGADRHSDDRGRHRRHQTRPGSGVNAGLRMRRGRASFRVGRFV